MKGAEARENFTVHARNGRLADPNEVIFPIFRTDSNGLLHFLATGFFVTRYGWFVTAKHVIEDVLDDRGKPNYGLSIIQFSEGRIYRVRPVTSCVCHDSADVAVGICAPMKHKVTGEPLFNKVLSLEPLLLLPGCPVWTYAYPSTTVVHSEKQHVNISPNFYVGEVAEFYSSGRDRWMLPAPCYRTTITLHAASSGGPVFGPGSAVVGINSTSIDGAEDVSFVSRIQDILPLGVPDVQIEGEEEQRRITISELAEMNHVALKK